MTPAKIIIDGTEYAIKAANVRYPCVSRQTIEAAAKDQPAWSLAQLQALQARRDLAARHARIEVAAGSKLRKGFRNPIGGEAAAR